MAQQKDAGEGIHVSTYMLDKPRANLRPREPEATIHVMCWLTVTREADCACLICLPRLLTVRQLLARLKSLSKKIIGSSTLALTSTCVLVTLLEFIKTQKDFGTIITENGLGFPGHTITTCVDAIGDKTECVPVEGLSVNILSVGR